MASLVSCVEPPGYARGDHCLFPSAARWGSLVGMGHLRTVTPRVRGRRHAGDARRLVAEVGGRFTTELGLDVDHSPPDVEGWFLAATLFGTPIAATVVGRTYRTMRDAGVASVADAGLRTWNELVDLLDRGGYVRYDYRTATRLLDLARAVSERHGGRVASLSALTDPAELEAALDALPGWGPVTVRLFLRELRGVWPGARPPLDERALGAAQELGFVRPGTRDPFARLKTVATRDGIDVRELEAALVRLTLRGRSGARFDDTRKAGSPR